MNAAEAREQVSEALEPYLDLDQIPGREDLARLDRRVRGFVAERPVAAVLIALAAGYALGRVLSRVS